jgi:hypothetical protein
MARRWSIEEEKALSEVRKRLQKELNEQISFPEGKKLQVCCAFDHCSVLVVGDRRILRFLRGKQMNIDIATSTFKEFLSFRKKNNVDAIRQDIVYGGKNTPWKFPKGNVILPLAPQIIVAPNSLDKHRQPLGSGHFLLFYLSFYHPSSYCGLSSFSFRSLWV